MNKRLEKTNIEWIRADKLFVDPKDIELDRQRSPEERKAALIKRFGAKGENFSLEHCGVLKGKRRSNGMVALKDGGGRWWVVMNLLKEPGLKLPVVLMENASDLEAFRIAQESIVVPAGKLFMAHGHDPKNKYEHLVCNVLRELEFTATPAQGRRSVQLNQTIFAYDLGVLRTTLILARTYWLRNKSEKRIEGLAMAGLAGFLYIYKDHPDFQMSRLKQVLESISYGALKDSARRWLPEKKEHQRQWGVAFARELVDRYNLGLKKTPRLPVHLIQELQSKVINHNHYSVFAQVWEMRKIVAEDANE